jgi:tripartite-type tricarboxylate transporter receptor subunit TctC
MPGLGSALRCLLFSLLAVQLGSLAHAQSYPTRPVTIILTLGAGTGMDTMVRLYAERLSQKLGKPVVVENRPGGSQAIGSQAVATAAPDGHTLLVATSGAMAISPALFKQISYNPERDFVPVALYVKAPFILIADPGLPFRTVPDFIRHAKDAKVPLTYSSIGPGSPQHLSMEFTKQRFGLAMTHVPYRSSGQAVADTIAGHVNVGFADAGSSLPAVQDGKVRALAVSALTRLPSLPDVPPFAEAANAPDFEAVSWHALFAPARTPREIVDRLHQEMKEIMAAPDMKQSSIKVGLIPIDTPSIEGIRAYVKSEQDKWGSLVRHLGLAGSQ